MRSAAALLTFVVLGACTYSSTALGAGIKPIEVGTWRATSLSPTNLSATTFASMTVKVRSVGVNETAGSVTFYASGGKKTCQARLVFLGRSGYFGGTPKFAVRFKSGAPKRARSFCRPSHNGYRLQLAGRGDGEPDQASITIWHGMSEFDFYSQAADRV